MQVLYTGNETYLSFTNAYTTVKELVEEKSSEYISIDAEKEEVSKIIDTLSSFPLFASSRVIFLKRVYRNRDRKALIEFLLEYLDTNLTDDIVIWEDQKVSSVTKYIKYFKNKDTLREYNKITKPSFRKYVQERCLERDITIETDAMSILIQYSNYDIQRFENTLHKITLLDSTSISEKDIEDITADTLEENIWHLLDEINSRDGKPLAILEKIFLQEKDPYYIFPMIVRNLRLITLTKYLLETSSYDKIASRLKIPPFTVKSLVEATTKYDWEKLLSKYEKLSNLDYEIKIGRIDPKLGLTLFCTTA